MYRSELGTQAAVRQAQRVREADEKKWAAEEMQMYQEVLKQEDELKRVQEQVKKRELADSYADQISLSKQRKEDTSKPGASFRDVSRAEAADRWVADSKDEVATRALEKEQREQVARRNKQSATNEALRQQVEEKKQRDLAAKLTEKREADAYIHRVKEGVKQEAHAASMRRHQQLQFGRDLDVSKQIQEPDVPEEAPRAAGMLINKENSTQARKAAEFRPVHMKSPFATEVAEPASRKPVARASAPYAVNGDAVLPTKVTPKPRSSAPFALNDELEPARGAHPTDIPGVPRHLTAFQRQQYDMAAQAKRGRY
jgi:hypothetical protein